MQPCTDMNDQKLKHQQFICQHQAETKDYIFILLNGATSMSLSAKQKYCRGSNKLPAAQNFRQAVIFFLAVAADDFSLDTVSMRI